MMLMSRRSKGDEDRTKRWATEHAIFEDDMGQALMVKDEDDDDDDKDDDDEDEGEEWISNQAVSMQSLIDS